MPVNSATVPESKIILSKDAIKEIERIIKKGGNAKVATKKGGGVTVYEETMKIKYSQS